MHKFLVRAASGIVYAAVIILAIIYGGWTIYAMALIFATIGFCELNKMAMGFSPKLLPVYLFSVIGVLLAISVVKFSASIPYLWVIILCAVFLLIVYAYYRATAKAYGTSLKDFRDGDYRRTPLFGFGYLAIPLSLMTVFPIQRLSLLVFVLLWINDSGAYIVGSLTGRHKLCPSISPNKTWEGFIGGCILTVAGALLLDLWCDSFFGMADISLWIWIILGVLTCIFGTLGDLLESKIKRFYGAKDSGHWIPGHGGILDRIDSFLLAYPIVAIALCLIIG